MPDRVGEFENAPHVAWLGPRLDAALAALLCDVQALGSTHGSGAFTRQLVGAWNPHVTVAWGLSGEALAETLAMLRELRLPSHGTGVALGVIDTPAEIELERIELRG